jgi:hypothetical protein
MRAKALWSKQPDDALVQAEWVDAFGRLEYRDVFEALTECRDAFDDPPVIGQIRRVALRVADRREADERAQRRTLEDQSRDPELVSVKEMVSAFLERQGTSREEVYRKLGWDKPK